MLKETSILISASCLFFCERFVKRERNESADDVGVYYYLNKPGDKANWGNCSLFYCYGMEYPVHEGCGECGRKPYHNSAYNVNNTHCGSNISGKKFCIELHNFTATPK